MLLLCEVARHCKTVDTTTLCRGRDISADHLAVADEQRCVYARFRIRVIRDAIAVLLHALTAVGREIKVLRSLQFVVALEDLVRLARDANLLSLLRIRVDLPAAS